MDDRDIFCLGNELDSCAIKGCCNIKKNNRAIWLPIAYAVAEWSAWFQKSTTDIWTLYYLKKCTGKAKDAS